MPCSKRMLGCNPQCAHRSKVMDYYRERQRQLDLADEVSLGYETERQEYLQQHPAITFKDYLIHTRQEQEDNQ